MFESFHQLKCNFDASIVQTPPYINPAIVMFDYEKETLKDLNETEEYIDKYMDHLIIMQNIGLIIL